MPDHIDMTKGVYRRIYSGCLRGDRINSVSRDAELLFWRIHCVADDFGNLIANPAELRVTAFPKRDVTEKQIVGWLKELADAQLITLYRVGSDQLANISDFTEYQPSGKNGKRIMRVPVNPGESGCIQVNPDFSSASEKKTITKTINTPTHAADAAGVCVGFDRFWQAWPKSLRKGARPQCLAKWRALDLEPMADRIVAAVQHFARSPEWTKDGGQFIPAPLVWLNQRRWEAVESVKASGTPTDPESRKRSDEFVAAWKRMAPAEREALAGSVRLAVSRIDDAVRWQTPPPAAVQTWKELQQAHKQGAAT